MNIAYNLENSALFFPDKCAVIEEGREITFSEFNEDANKIASTMFDMGIEPGDHIAFCAPNSYNWLVFYFGALKAGAVAVTFSYLLTKGEFNTIISDCKPKILFTNDERLADLSDNRKESYPKIVVCNKGDISFSDMHKKDLA